MPIQTDLIHVFQARAIGTPGNTASAAKWGGYGHAGERYEIVHVIREVTSVRMYIIGSQTSLGLRVGSRVQFRDIDGRPVQGQVMGMRRISTGISVGDVPDRNMALRAGA